MLFLKGDSNLKHFSFFSSTLLRLLNFQKFSNFLVYSKLLLLGTQEKLINQFVLHHRHLLVLIGPQVFIIGYVTNVM